MKKILIIEDNESMGKVLEKVFHDRGFEVAWVRDGEVGLRELGEIKPDIALLDMTLPSLSGYEILEARQRDPVLRKIPIVVISNSGQSIELERLKKLGVSDHIVKIEISPEEVFDKVSAVLGGEPQGKAEFCLDEEECTVNLKDIKIMWIEDDMFLGSIVSKKLSTTGAHFIQSKSGEDAFSFIQGELPSIIILDLVLPGMSGFEILEKLKADPRTAPIPVIVLSNLDQRDDMERCFKLGASKYFVKALVTLDRIFEEIPKLVKIP